MTTTVTPLLTAAQVAELLQCTVRTANESAAAGRLPAVKFGSGWVFPATALLDAVNDLAKQEARARAVPSKSKATKVYPSRPNLSILEHRASAASPQPG